MKTNTTNNVSIIRGTRDYKGPKTAIKVFGTLIQPAPLVEGQKNYRLNSSIKGGKFADSFVPEKNMDANVSAEWVSLGYTLLSNVAYGKCNVTGVSLAEALHSTRWQVLFNQPSEYAVYCNKVTKSILGIIKFALMNGINVNVYDEFTDKVWQFKSVANMTMCPLYQNFYIDSTTDAGYKLEQAIKNYETKTWEAVEQEIADLSAAYYIENLEASEERAYWAKRYNVQDYLLQGNYSLTADQAMSPEVIEQMATVINIYGRAVGISCPTAERIATIDSYSLHRTGYKEITKTFINNKGDRTTVKQDFYINPVGNRPSYAGNEDRTTHRRTEIDPKIFTVKYQRQIKATMKPDALEVLQAYTQVMYFIENGIENFLDDNYTICTNCNLPVRKDATTCNHCDIIREPDTMDLDTLGKQLAVGSGNYKVTESINTTKIFRNNDEALIARYNELCSECVVTKTK